VGKSTLVNTIAPDLNLRTNNVSTFANKGVHTTTFAEMFEISPNTFIIDSPGIKELGLSEMEKEEISHYFPEMRDLLERMQISQLPAHRRTQMCCKRGSRSGRNRHEPL
jgi:ribosome biogenesis GTPase